MVTKWSGSEMARDEVCVAPLVQCVTVHRYGSDQYRLTATELGHY